MKALIYAIILSTLSFASFASVNSSETSDRSTSQYGDDGLKNQRSSYFNTDAWKEKEKGLAGKLVQSSCNLPIHFSGTNDGCK